MAQESKEPRIAPDWERIEVDYRAGVLTLREIATAHGITHGAINKRAKRDGWTRDLAAKIKAKAEALVSKAAVSAEVSKEKLATENAVVEANAQAQYRVRMEHRQDIARTRDLFRNLLKDLEVSGEYGDKIEELFEMLHDPGDGEKQSKAGEERLRKMREALDKVLSVPGRVDSGKRITEMLEKLVRMEREAFGIDERAGGDHAGARVVMVPAKDAA
jgi:hypothetical protein